MSNLIENVKLVENVKLIENVIEIDEPHPVELVKVNGRVIAEDIIAEEMQYHPADSAEQARFEAARALVVREILLQRAHELELAGSDEEALLQNLIQGEVSTPEPTEPSARLYYDNNLKRFTTHPRMMVSHILLPVAKEDMAGRKKVALQAEQILAAIEADSNWEARFIDEVRKHSACPSSDNGGSLGELEKGQTVAEFERQVFSLSKGLCHRPIETRYGYHIVKVDKRADGKVTPYAQVRDKIAAYLKARVQRKASAQYIEVLLGEADIEGIIIDTSSGLLQ